MKNSAEKRILITGGSGFIGTNLVEFFVSEGCAVQNFDINPPRNQDHNSFWERVNVLDRNLLIEKTQKFQPEVILHFAARTDLDERNDLDGYAANIEGTYHVIEAIRGTPSIQRAIFASSQLVCKLGYQPENEYDYCPTTLYGRSKVLMEKIIRSAEDINSNWMIVRPTSIWGPWFEVPYRNFFISIANNRYVHPGGMKTDKQWGFVGNMVYQINKLLEAERDEVHTRTFYLADYNLVDLSCFADFVQEAFGAKPIKSVPLNLLKFVARIGDSLQKAGWNSVPLTTFRLENITISETVNVAQLKEIVGPLPYTTKEGIYITVDWMRGMRFGR